MSRLVKNRPSPLFAISVITLLVALGGTGFATTRPGQPASGPAAAHKKRPGKKACLTSSTALCPALRGAVDVEIARQVRALNIHSGSPGAQGAPGPQGSQGSQGPQGPGATTFTTTVASGATLATLATLNNGLTVNGSCSAGQPSLKIQTLSGSNLQASGTTSQDSAMSAEDSNGFQSINATGTNNVDFDVIARDKTGGKFARVDVHGEAGTPCTFWGMIIPSG